MLTANLLSIYSRETFFPCKFCFLEKIFDPQHPHPHPHPEAHGPSDEDQSHHGHHNHHQHHHYNQHEHPHPHHPHPHPIRRPHHHNSGFNYPSESSRKLYYQMRPTSRPRMSSVNSKNNTQTSSDLRTSGHSLVNSTKEQVTSEKLSKSESINEPAYMKEYGRLNEYPNPDEGLKGWKETGYKIVTEVEYLDKGEL